jgi:hypothetical protein
MVSGVSTDPRRVNAQQASIRAAASTLSSDTTSSSSLSPTTFEHPGPAACHIRPARAERHRARVPADRRYRSDGQTAVLGRRQRRLLAGKPVRRGAAEVGGRARRLERTALLSDRQGLRGGSQPVVVHGRHSPWLGGCGAHVAGARHALFEADEDNDPHIYLAPGILTWWVNDAEGAEVRDAPTIFGALFGYRLRKDGAARTITIDITQPLGPGIRYIFPCRFGMVRSVTVDGQALVVLGERRGVARDYAACRDRLPVTRRAIVSVHRKTSMSGSLQVIRGSRACRAP